MINRKVFFDEIRVSLFKGKLKQTQVDSLNLFLDRYDKLGWNNLRKLAYVLGTVYHETNVYDENGDWLVLEPIEEVGRGSKKKYGKKIKYSGATYEQPDVIFFGRGHTQNTWFEIYEALTKEAKKQGLNWDFLNKPELLLQDEPSIWATFTAMEKGIYTGRKLSQYFNDKTCNWIGARAIINGNDKAKLIADYSELFHNALTK